MKTFSSIMLFSLTSITMFALFALAANEFIPADIILQLDNAGILLGYLLGCVSIGLGTVALVHRQDIGHRLRHWLRRSRFENVGEQFDGRVTAIVIPVSRIQQPEWIIRWLEPRYVAFLYTRHPDSQKAASELQERFGKHVTFFPNKEMIERNEYRIEEADRPSQTREMTRFFLKHFLELGVPSHEIFVDTTGGKVPMSIGAFQAAEELSISSIYIVGRDNGFINKPERREQGEAIFMSEHEGRS